MNLEPPKPTLYLNHRENQRERILEVAERLFILHGIDGVNLSDIARAARLTRNTVYEYFPNKQEVAWAILQKIFDHAEADLAGQPDGSGLEQLEHFMLQRINEVKTHPAHLRFIVEFNTLYAREASSERMRQIAGRASAAGEDQVARLVRQGMADGSIHADLDPWLVSAAIWNLLSGMNARFALLEDRVEQEYGQPVMAIYQEICRAFLRGIQSSQEKRETD
jgi:AcrR family transcriptional regulator